MFSQAELKIHKANTKAFIATNPSVLQLIPRTRIKDGSGTRFMNGTPRDPQTFKLIDQSTSRNTIPGKIRTSDGVERLIDYILLAESDALVELWDYWADSDGTWEVGEIYPSNQYEIRAAVVRRAEGNQHNARTQFG